jgi:hypothetical protein
MNGCRRYWTLRDAYLLIDETFRGGMGAPGMADYVYDELKQQCW